MGSLPRSEFKVSVVIPVFNSERYLAKCLGSILAQTLDRIEVVVVDDGSTDGSPDLLAGYQAEHPQIKVYRQPNAGLAAARNRGIKEARGEFVSFLDSDDYIHPSMLEKMYLRVQQESSDICICQFQQVDELGETIETSAFPASVTADDCFRLILSSRESSMACNKLVRADLFQHNGISFPVGLLHEDVPTIYKLFHFADSVSVLDEPLYYWVRREGTLSKSISLKHAIDLMWGFALARDFLRDHDLLPYYRRELFRRVAHFSVGVIGRYRHSGDGGTDALLVTILKCWIDLLGFGGDGDLAGLRNMDPVLHRKYVAMFPSQNSIDQSGSRQRERELQDRLNTMEQRLLLIESSNSYRIMKKVTSRLGRAFPEGTRRRGLMKQLGTRMSRFRQV